MRLDVGAAVMLLFLLPGRPLPFARLHNRGGMVCRSIQAALAKAGLQRRNSLHHFIIWVALNHGMHARQRSPVLAVQLVYLDTDGTSSGFQGLRVMYKAALIPNCTGQRRTPHHNQVILHAPTVEAFTLPL